MTREEIGAAARRGSGETLARINRAVDIASRYWSARVICLAVIAVQRVAVQAELLGRLRSHALISCWHAQDSAVPLVCMVVLVGPDLMAELSLALGPAAAARLDHQGGNILPFGYHVLGVNLDPERRKTGQYQMAEAHVGMIEKVLLGVGSDVLGEDEGCSRDVGRVQPRPIACCAEATPRSFGRHVVLVDLDARFRQTLHDDAAKGRAWVGLDVCVDTLPHIGRQRQIRPER